MHKFVQSSVAEKGGISCLEKEKVKHLMLSTGSTTCTNCPAGTYSGIFGVVQHMFQNKFSSRFNMVKYNSRAKYWPRISFYIYVKNKRHKVYSTNILFVQVTYNLCNLYLAIFCGVDLVLFIIHFHAVKLRQILTIIICGHPPGLAW